jgi:dTDP-4-dehydrorhamnose reductase
MARILILGGGGALARSAADRIRRTKVSLQPTFLDPLEVVSIPRSEFDVTKFAEFDALLARIQPDLLLYAAGRTDIHLCEWDKWPAYLVNRDGAEQMAKACTRAGVFMVYFSTDLVFDGARRIPYREEDPPGPLTVYADTKLAGELAVMTHAKRHLILRTGWLYGVHHKTFVSTALERLRSEDRLFASEASFRQPTAVDDFLDAVFQLLAKGRTGTWHVASGGGASELDVAKKLVSLVRPSAVAKAMEIPGGGRPLLPSYSILDCSKAAIDGIQLRKWDEALTNYVRSLRGGDTEIIRK